MNKINIAVVGCGDIAHIRYFNAITKLKDKFHLTGVYDIVPEVTKKTAAEFQVQGFDSLEGLLSQPELDTVVVTTYHPCHAQIAVEAMNHGKNVIIEKPDQALPMQSLCAIRQKVPESFAWHCHLRFIRHLWKQNG